MKNKNLILKDKDFIEAVFMRLITEQCVGWHSDTSAYLYLKENDLI